MGLVWGREVIKFCNIHIVPSYFRQNFVSLLKCLLLKHVIIPNAFQARIKNGLMNIIWSSKKLQNNIYKSSNIQTKYQLLSVYQERHMILNLCKIYQYYLRFKIIHTRGTHELILFEKDLMLFIACQFKILFKSYISKSTNKYLDKVYFRHNQDHSKFIYF